MKIAFESPFNDEVVSERQTSSFNSRNIDELETLSPFQNLEMEENFHGDVLINKSEFISSEEMDHNKEPVIGEGYLVENVSEEQCFELTESEYLEGDKIYFPSGEYLLVVKNNTGEQEEHWDSPGSGNPLLDTSGANQNKYLSKNFQVKEFARNSQTEARIDVKLVEALQKIRDVIGSSINITSGYRSYLYNKNLYTGYIRKWEEKKAKGESVGEKPKWTTQSRHIAGSAVDFNVKGYNGKDLAKKVIDILGCGNYGIGLGWTFIHLDVFRDHFTLWNYSNVSDSWITEINSYYRNCKGIPSPSTSSPSYVSGYVKDMPRAIRLNKDNSQSLGWGVYLDKINDLLLPYSGLQNVSLPDDDFAQAVSIWQSQNGFSIKDSDGIIGKNTWSKMQLQLQNSGAGNTATTSSSSTSSPSSSSPSSVSGYVTDIPRAIRLNKDNSESLGWGVYLDKINDLLLPYSGLQNVSLADDDFAQAVSIWQSRNGFSIKDSDGIIGKNTWSKMQSLLTTSTAQITGNPKPPQGSVSNITVSSSVVSNIDRFKDIIEKQSAANGINPNIIRGIIAAESGGDSQKGAKGGYKGLMQAETSEDQLQPEVSLKTGIEKFILFRDKILNPWLTKLGINRFSIDEDNYLKMCLCSYNAGPVTALKSIQYAHLEGEWKQWLSPENYCRALLFSGGYKEYSNCSKGVSSTEIATARKERLTYKFKTAGWRTEPDPPLWNNIVSSLNSTMRCWLETKYNNTPGYLDKFIGYYKHYESISTDNETFIENDFEDIEFIQESILPDHQFFNEFNYQVKDWSKAIRLNRGYGKNLGWDQFYDQINKLVLPFSGYQNISLGEEDFARAVAAWQTSKGLSSKDSDGIIGPNTLRLMKPFILTGSSTTTPSTPSVPTSGPANDANLQMELSSNPNLRARYQTIQAYKTIRDMVTSWRISNPASFIETSIIEWNNNTGIHIHFDRNFDGDPHRSYLNLKRLYQAKGISDPAGYFSANIVPITFFNRSTPGHRDLKAVLDAGQRALLSSGNNYSFSSAWSFVPRTYNDNIGKLSNHALGKAIDINPSSNPHIKSSDEILVINTVCKSILPAGLLSEINPDVLRRASSFFQSNFNDVWISQQSPDVRNAANRRRSYLNKYASNGFMTLPSALVKGLQKAGLGWGGTWKNAKDFMHFELPNA